MKNFSFMHDMTIEEMRNMVRGAKVIENNARDLELQVATFAHKIGNDEDLQAATQLINAAVRALRDARNRIEVQANEYLRVNDPVTEGQIKRSGSNSHPATAKPANFQPPGQG